MKHRAFDTSRAGLARGRDGSRAVPHVRDFRGLKPRGLESLLRHG
jgi:hypothetical protein